MAAKVLSNVNLLSSSSCSNQHHKELSFGKYGSVLPSVKLKAQGLKTDFHGIKLSLQPNLNIKKGNFHFAVKSQTGLRIGRAQKWWEKGLQPNMKEVTSAQDFVDSLMNAGDKLVIVDFFSPGCGGCKALHPKICQLAEMNPDVQFVQVNYEEHKSMCYSLNVHVLPFFRFYRGAHGRLCSFSCTNATIKKFKDALAKHTTERCSLGPTKGLEEKELLALAANKDLNFTYTPKPVQPAPAKVVVGELSSDSSSKLPLPHPHPSATPKSAPEEEKTLVGAGR